METAGNMKPRMALVFGTLPTVEEIDQFALLTDEFDIKVVSSESICRYLTETSMFHNLQCVALPDHEDDPSFLPGLEKVLNKDFDIVLLKERLGMYSYQTVKCKWRNQFRLVVWCDNLTPFPGEDIERMQIIRTEVNNNADAFLVQSKAARNTLMAEGVEEERIVSMRPWVTRRVNRNGRTKAKALKTLGLNDGDFVIAHIGQIEWEESLLDLVHGAKTAIDTDRNLRNKLKLVFCGVGSFAGELRERLVALGLDRRVVVAAPSREAFSTVLTAADALFYSPVPSRDRIEGDPYRLMVGMANELPIISSRNPIVEEFVGKHRIDWCISSADSLAKALKKVSAATALRNNIVKKNVATLESRFHKNKTSLEMREIFNRIVRQKSVVDAKAVEHQVFEVESLVATKQYLAAIDLIESIFANAELPLHHNANLLRLIGDCFTKLGDGEAGKKAYNHALECDPYSYKAHVGLGTIGLTKNSHDIAVIHFQKAISLAPDDEMTNLGLGLAFQGLGENEEANRWVAKSLDINPENTAGIYTAVQLAYELDRFEVADVSLRRYLEKHPEDHNMLYTLAGISFKLGRNQESLNMLDRILAVDGNDDRSLTLAKQIRRSMEQAQASSSM